ncbi:MAG: hypothetical protein U0526_02125 [Candidatus Saccharibacteria bacterium]|jgi:uncharacterized membrane protein YeaQ/YmgE (transglycosylase-associated protein family)
MKRSSRLIIIIISLIAPMLVGWLRGMNDPSGWSTLVGFFIGSIGAVIIGIAGALVAFLLRNRPNEHISLYVYCLASISLCVFLLATA